MESNYWSTVFTRRVSRRRALRAAGAGGATLAAGGLIACGDDDDDGGAQTKAADSGAKKQPKPGGTLSFELSNAPPTLDPYTGTSFVTSYHNGLTYSKLLRFKAGVPEIDPGDFSMEPDMAQAMPEQPDQNTFVFKLKPNIKFSNGRAVTSEDVKYAFDRYQTFDRSVHKANWTWMDKVETPAPDTVVIKAKYPYADAIQIVGGSLGGYISPKEHAESADAPTKMLGSGPFILKEYQTGVSLTYVKNPDYYDKPYPYLDEVKIFIVPDTAKRVADFSAKSVNLSWLFLPDERDQIKRNVPEAKFEETQGIGSYIYVRGDKPPFNDKRVRQAMSMGINRAAIRQAISKGEGQPDQTIFIGFKEWARPVKDLGANAKYWDYNPAEAKKLLAAAGQEKIETTWTHADAAIYTQAYVDIATLAQQQLKEIGFTIQDKIQPYAQYISTTYQGQYEGMGHSPRAVPWFIDFISERLITESDGKRGRINLSYINNPKLNALLVKQRGQFNAEERKKTVREIEDLIAEEQYEIYFSTDTRTYFWLPEVQNYRPSSFFPYTHLMKTWIDKA